MKENVQLVVKNWNSPVAFREVFLKIARERVAVCDQLEHSSLIG